MPTDKPKLKANIGIVYGMGKTNAGRKRRELRTSEGRSKNGQDRDARVNHLIPTKSSKCDKNILKISVAVVVRVGVRGGGWFYLGVNTGMTLVSARPHRRQNERGQYTQPQEALKSMTFSCSTSSACFSAISLGLILEKPATTFQTTLWLSGYK